MAIIVLSTFNVLLASGKQFFKGLLAFTSRANSVWTEKLASISVQIQTTKQTGNGLNCGLSSATWLPSRRSRTSVQEAEGRRWLRESGGGQWGRRGARRPA